MLAHRVAFRFKYGMEGWSEVTGGDRLGFVEPLWELYKESYAKIGMHLTGPQALLKYELWAIYGTTPKAFVCWSREPFGWKVGVLGSDGTSDGKGAIFDYFPAMIKREGFYGEVSHAIEKLTSRAPVVCAVFVPEIIGKAIEPSADGVHYTRTLQGVGAVEKILVGNPRGFPTTNRRSPSCPIGQPAQENVVRLAHGIDEHDLANHFACLYT